MIWRQPWQGKWTTTFEDSSYGNRLRRKPWCATCHDSGPPTAAAAGAGRTTCNRKSACRVSWKVTMSTQGKHLAFLACCKTMEGVQLSRSTAHCLPHRSLFLLMYDSFILCIVHRCFHCFHESFRASISMSLFLRCLLCQAACDLRRGHDSPRPHDARLVMHVCGHICHLITSRDLRHTFYA